jgi:hypothetical protein
MEISRFMSKPEEQDWRSAKRFARYVSDSRRVVIEYKYQKLPEKVVVWSDTDFAIALGDLHHEESPCAGSTASGRAAWIQETMALSSGESEFYGIVKVATMGLGMKRLTEDRGVAVEVHVNTDS